MVSDSEITLDVYPRKVRVESPGASALPEVRGAALPRARGRRAPRPPGAARVHGLPPDRRPAGAQGLRHHGLAARGVLMVRYR